MKATNGVTMRKLEYFTTPTMSKLNRAEFLYKLGSCLRKPYKKISDMKWAMIKTKKKYNRKVAKIPYCYAT